MTTGNKGIFLDFSNLLVPLGAFGTDTFDERGFLGFAFHPQYAGNGLLYTYTSEPAGESSDFSTIPPDSSANHRSVIREWRLSAIDSGQATVENVRILMTVDQPQFNHNAGALNFGPDGMLYIALEDGDGGGADDRDGQAFIGNPITGHGATGNGQNTANPLGSLLRIDPSGTNSHNGQYGIPADNPFAGSDTVLNEIYAYGFRNPFRFSFDAISGALVLADVGQNDIEEVNLIQAGGNYGWSLKEGSFRFEPNGNDAGFVTSERRPPEISSIRWCSMITMKVPPLSAALSIAAARLPHCSKLMCLAMQPKREAAMAGYFTAMAPKFWRLI